MDQALKNKVDAALVAFWKELVDRQATYFAKHGKYFQLLISPSVAVADGATNSFSLRIPADEKNPLDVVVLNEAPIPFQILVDEWIGGKSTVGFFATATVWYKDSIYRRTRTSANIDTGWYKYIPL